MRERCMEMERKTEEKSEECAGANLLPSPTNRKNSNWN